MVYTLEKKVLVEFIEMYRDLPCLWDTSHKLYSNKMARNRALDTLHVKYKELDAFADQRRMKKKIENMRTTYRRERNKVVKSQYSGGEVYEPSLWYYNEMKFLDDLNDPSQSDISISIQNVESVNDDDDDDEATQRSVSPTPPAKRAKPTSVYLTESDHEYIETMKMSPTAKKAKKSSVFLEEDDNAYQEEPSCSVKNEPSDLYNIGVSSESNLFGKTISAQLNELRPKQRFIAEKLISDVIFFGRLDKLKTGTTLNLNDDL